MRILKLLILLLACAVGGQALAQQPWPGTTSNSGETLLAWNGGGHGGRHFHKHHHKHFYGHKHFRHHRGYYNHGPRVIYAPRYYGGYAHPYYYPRYGGPRVVIQYYDPRLGIFIGTDLGRY
ncbi:hypothetical protein ACFPU0_07065 [Pseudomonas sp. GCM10022186]|uniref:hypothetical protein n=1 Tax=Pseudomonas sp. GCM10022186 TaxID=3252650 RepID=UPI00360F228F